VTDTGHRIVDEARLEEVLGAPLEFVRSKVLPRLNEAMVQFIARSPLAFVSTIDVDGHPDVSPKGDPAGFVTVDGAGDLLIPERLGNRLMFGFRNILRGGEKGGEIGLIFVVPNQLETLRVKGRASLHADPDVLAAMQVGGKPALLYTRVEVQECFFHCGKALLRSHLWQPEAWDAERRSIAARGLMSPGLLDEGAVRQTEAALDRAYAQDLY
jgi:PPOX class probable FMN-dependent enzyme